MMLLSGVLVVNVSNPTEHITVVHANDVFEKWIIIAHGKVIAACSSYFFEVFGWLVVVYFDITSRATIQ